MTPPPSLFDRTSRLLCRPRPLRIGARVGLFRGGNPAVDTGIDAANCRKTNEAKGSGRENVTPHEDDLPANHCNGQFRAAGKYQPVPVHRPVK
jgi:hypothetical protein